MTNTVAITGTDVTVTVDGVIVFPTSGPGPQPPPTRPAIGSNGGIMWGTNGHPVQGGSPYASMPLVQQFNGIKGMGLRDYRIDLYEAEDHSQALLTSALAEGGKAGVNVLPCVIPDYQSYGNENEAFEAGKVLARTYARNFPQVLCWEWGNEYELWDGAQKPGTQGSFIDDYDWRLFCLARGTYRGLLEGMRDGNPAAKGCINTSGHGHWGWTDQLWADGIRWDITGEHFYSAEGNVDIRHLYLMVGETDKLALLKQKYGKPIFMTEFNYWAPEGSDGEKPQMADYLGKTMAQYDGFAKTYGLERVHIYELLDEPQAPGREGQLGLATGNALNIAGHAVRDYLAAHPSVIYASGDPVTGRRR